MSATRKNRSRIPITSSDPSDYLALDCEMVGVGRKGSYSRLGEVAIVDWDGKTIYHSYVKPEEEVTDYRTPHSGLTKEILDSKGRPFSQVQAEVLEVLRGHIVVGHALENDFRALKIRYIPEFTRNTAKLPMFQQVDRTGRLMPRRLQAIAKNFLGETIQVAEHDPAEDARAAMELYKRYKSEFDTKSGGGKRYTRRNNSVRNLKR
jgi:RNA exonuclease 4